jgi:hypothetical protein
MEEAILKVVATINSCENWEHLNATRRYIDLFLENFDNAYFNCLINRYELKKQELNG